MNCKTVFKINVSCISDEEVFSIIDYIGIEPGITDSFLFFGLICRDTEEEHYTLHDQLNDTLCLLYDKANILVSLKNQYNIYYSIDVKFSDIEEEIYKKTSFLIDDKAKDFIEKVDAFYNLNDGYFE